MKFPSLFEILIVIKALLYKNAIEDNNLQVIFSTISIQLKRFDNCLVFYLREII